jgi:hypothetical protein
MILSQFTMSQSLTCALMPGAEMVYLPSGPGAGMTALTAESAKAKRTAFEYFILTDDV